MSIHINEFSVFIKYLANIKKISKFPTIAFLDYENRHKNMSFYKRDFAFYNFYANGKNKKDKLNQVYLK